MNKEEILKAEREKVDIMADAVSKIYQYMRRDDIYEDKEAFQRVVNLSMKLRAYSNSFTQTARIINVDNGWDQLD